MNNYRIIGRTPFGLEYAGNSFRIKRVSAKSVNCFRWKRHQLAARQQLGRVVDCICLRSFRINVQNLCFDPSPPMLILEYLIKLSHNSVDAIDYIRL
jgi:hypothetical protein